MQHTRWLIFLETKPALKLQQHYPDGLYIKVWVEQLQVLTDDLIAPHLVQLQAAC